MGKIRGNLASKANFKKLELRGQSIINQSIHLLANSCIYLTSLILTRLIFHFLAKANYKKNGQPL